MHLYHLISFVALTAACAALGACAAQPVGPRSASVPTPAGPARIVYDVFGKGEPALVFIHGWSVDRRFWRAQMDALASQRRVLALDLIGHGESDKPDVEYSMDLFAQCVAAAMDDAGVDRAVLIGHSNGVIVARQFSRLFPRRVAGLILADSRFQPLPESVARWMLAALERSDYQQYLRAAVEQTPRGRLTDEQYEWIKASTLAMPKHVMLGGLKAMQDKRLWAGDPIQAPTLVLASGQTVAAAGGETAFHAEVAAVAPKAIVEIWTDASHFLTLEEPERFNALIRRFLASLH